MHRSFNRIRRQMAPTCTPSRSGSLGAKNYPSDGVSVGSAVFPQLTEVTNTKTDYATYDICSYRTHPKQCFGNNDYRESEKNYGIL